jgi:hypothetical protein
VKDTETGGAALAAFALTACWLLRESPVTTPDAIRAPKDTRPAITVQQAKKRNRVLASM